MNKGLNSNGIKLVAIAAMTADHIAWLLFPGYPREMIPLLLHIIGRITCPIMCYCIAEGYHYTGNINKYTFRLFAFALISHVPYVMASINYVDAGSFVPFYYGSVLNQTSVIWALAWGLVMLRVTNSSKIKGNAAKTLLVLLICLLAFPADWSCVASLCVLAIGSNRGNFRAQMLWMIFYVAIYATVYFFALDEVYGLVQLAVVLSVPVLRLYNGKRGKSKSVNKFMKWGFYIYYPAHLFVIGLVGLVK